MTDGPPGARSPGSHGGWTLALGGALLVLGLTLSPASGPRVEVGSLCLLCGSKGLADAILNTVLFVPLGLGLARLGGWRAALLGALALSGAVEALQLLRPDRYATLGDLAFNTAGGLLGAALASALRDPAKALAGLGPRGRGAARAASVLLIALPPALMVPRYPASVWYGQWAPDLGNFERYGGEVLAARVGAVPLRNGRLEDTAPLRRALEAGEDLVVRFVTGPAPRDLAPLVAIYDASQRQIVMVAVAREAVVYARYARSADVRLDHPGVAWGGALAAPPGDTARLRVARSRAGVTLSVDGVELPRTGLGTRDGWRLLLDPGPTTPPWALSLLGLLWLVGCALPAGVVASAGRALPWGVALAALATLAPWAAPELLPHPTAPLGALVGVLLGARLGATLRGRAATPAPEAGEPRGGAREPA